MSDMRYKSNYIVVFDVIMIICRKMFVRLYSPKSLIFIMMIISFLSKLNCQNIAVKTNVLYDLTSSLNIGGEIKCKICYPGLSGISEETEAQPLNKYILLFRRQ